MGMLLNKGRAKKRGCMESELLNPTAENNEGFLAWLKMRLDVVRRVVELFLLSRTILVLAGWFTDQFQKNPSYQHLIDQGYAFIPRFFVDMWCRWDTGWYMSIAAHGYDPGPDLGSAYSNMAFFPLYPKMVRAVAAVTGKISTGTLTAIGPLLSSLFFILSLLMLYYLTLTVFSDRENREEIAWRTVLILTCMPAAYFFSAFYTESLYLLMSLGVYLAAIKKRWWLSALFTTGATLTRANGFLVILMPIWIYMEQRDWDFRRIGWQWTWFFMAPAGLAIHFYTLYLKTGNFFAFFQAQKAWQRGTQSFLQIVVEFFMPQNDRYPHVAIIDRLAFLSFAVISVILLVRIKEMRALGVYACGLMAIYLASGLMYSMTRYTVVVFPVIMWLGLKANSKRKLLWLCALTAMLQVLMWAGWTNYYWIA